MRLWRLRSVGLAASMMLLPLLLVSGQAQDTQQQEQQPAKEEQQWVIGLDGGTYLPYLPRVVEEVQSALRDEGLYSGEVDGILDHDTKEAIGEFQKEHGIMVSGIPSPATREALLGQP